MTGFLISEEYIQDIEDIRSRVAALESGVAESVPEYNEDSKFFVRLTTLGDLTVFDPAPFPDVLVPYIAEIVVWNRVTVVANYDWVSTGGTLNPDIPESETNTQEYVYAANGSQSLVGKVFAMDRRVAQSAGADIEYWVIVDSPGGGGSSLAYIEITADTNISTYTGTIYDNPIDRNVIEVGVTVRSLKQSDGTIPDSAVGQGEWCIFDSVNDVYHVVNPSIAYGVP